MGLSTSWFVYWSVWFFDKPQVKSCMTPRREVSLFLRELSKVLSHLNFENHTKIEEGKAAWSSEKCKKIKSHAPSSFLLNPPLLIFRTHNFVCFVVERWVEFFKINYIMELINSHKRANTHTHTHTCLFALKCS